MFQPGLIKLPGRAWAIWLTAICLSLGAVDARTQSPNFSNSGQPPDPGLELLQQEPHDLIFFKAEAGGGWVKAVPLELPGGKLPAEPTGNLEFQILGMEGKQFVASWSDIERVDLWDIRLARETKQRIEAEDFVGAYPFLSVLLRDHPDRPGLQQLRCEFLWKDAQARAKRGEIPNTLAMLEELRRFAPNFKQREVIRAIDGVTNRLMADYVKAGEMELAQRVLARIEKQYVNDRLSAVARWNNEFLKLATAKQEQAMAAIEAQDFRAARRLARESIDLKPTIEGGQALVRRINELYPLVRVGVLQTATDLQPTRLDNWGARRSGRLIYRTLFEMEGAGPEGGEYDFIFGNVEPSTDRMHFELNLEPEKLPPPLNRIQGQYVADVMARRAQEESNTYFAPWAAAVQSIGMNGPRQVTFTLRRPNVLPVCLLQVPVDGSWFGGEPNSPTGDYRRASVAERESRYLLIGEPITPTQPKEIVEIRCESAADGVNLLLQGEIDVLDQLFPADAIRLRRSKDVRVANYPLPTIHMLIPCSDHPYVALRTFRRALMYGTNRQDILQGELLEGLDSDGCRVLSGPFPAGLALNDPLGYAYDQSIEPRPYEPPLARLLLAMNANQMKATAERNKEEVPVMTPIRLALPQDNLSRVACEAIKSQWELLGLEVQLVELPLGQTFPDRDQDLADIVYVSAAVWEPVIDARRVLGPEGLAGSTDQLVGLGLRRIEEARNWKQVRDRLLGLACHCPSRAARVAALANGRFVCLPSRDHRHWVGYRFALSKRQQMAVGTMIRHPLTIPMLVIALLAAASGRSADSQPQPPGSSPVPNGQPAVPASGAASSPDPPLPDVTQIPWDYRPYRVLLWLAADDPAINAAAISEPLQQFIDRDFSAVWRTRISDAPSALAALASRDLHALDFDLITATDPVLAVKRDHPDAVRIRTTAQVGEFCQQVLATQRRIGQVMRGAAESGDATLAGVGPRLTAVAGDEATVAEQWAAAETEALLVSKGVGRRLIEPEAKLIPLPIGGLIGQSVEDYDKIFVIQIRGNRVPGTVAVVELDTLMQHVGPVAEVHFANRSGLPAAIGRALVKAFAPVVRIENAGMRNATGLLRAGGLIVDDLSPAAVGVGDVLEPMIRKNDRNGRPTTIGSMEWAVLLATEQQGRFLKMDF